MGSNVIFRYDWPIKPQNLCPWLVKSSQWNFNLQSPDCYLVRSYLITYNCKYTSSLNFFTGFGVTELCWFSNKMALLVYFAVPFAGVMGLNIFLFVFSACMVYDSTKATSKMTTCGPRTNFHLYLRYEYLHFRDNYLVQLIEYPILRTPNFNFPNLTDDLGEKEA